MHPYTTARRRPPLGRSVFGCPDSVEVQTRATPRAPEEPDHGKYVPGRRIVGQTHPLLDLENHAVRGLEPI